MKDGIIKIDSKRAKPFDFTSDKFYMDSYLWKTGSSITISFIASKSPGKGDFSKLVKTIINKGFTVKVPTPFATMRAILRRWQFTPTMEGPCEMWISPPHVGPGS